MSSRIAEAVLQLDRPSVEGPPYRGDDDMLQLFTSYALMRQSVLHSRVFFSAPSSVTSTTTNRPLESFLGEIPYPGAEVPESDTVATRVQLLASHDTTLSSTLWRQALERVRTHMARSPTQVGEVGASAVELRGAGSTSSTRRAAASGRVGRSGHPTVSPEAEWEAVWNWLTPGAPLEVVASLVQIFVDSAMNFQHRATALPPYFLLLTARQLRWLRSRVDLWSSDNFTRQRSNSLEDNGSADWLKAIVEDAYLSLMDHAACGFSEDLECFCLAFRASSQRAPVLSKLKSIAQQLRETVGHSSAGAEDATVVAMLQVITDAALLPLTRVALDACSDGQTHTPAARNLAQLACEVEAVVGSAAATEMPNLQTLNHCLQE